MTIDELDPASDGMGCDRFSSGFFRFLPLFLELRYLEPQTGASPKAGREARRTMARPVSAIISHGCLAIRACSGGRECLPGTQGEPSRPDRVLVVS